MNRIAVAQELVRIAKSLTSIGGGVMSSFEIALKQAISDKIREEKRMGTLSMSADNLMQVVRPPSASLDGAPRGTNARYFYAEMFRNLCDKEFRSFVKTAKNFVAHTGMAKEFNDIQGRLTDISIEIEDARDWAPWTTQSQQFLDKASAAIGLAIRNMTLAEKVRDPNQMYGAGFSRY